MEFDSCQILFDKYGKKNVVGVTPTTGSTPTTGYYPLFDLLSCLRLSKDEYRTNLAILQLFVCRTVKLFIFVVCHHANIILVICMME
jgi:hypothetical protein